MTGSDTTVVTTAKPVAVPEATIEVAAEGEATSAEPTISTQHFPALDATPDQPQSTVSITPTTVIDAAPVVAPVVDQAAPVIPVVDATPVVDQAAPIVDVAPTVDQAPVADAAPAVAPPHEPVHIAFFNQYLSFVRDGKSNHAIKSLNNSIKTMLNVGTQESFDSVLSVFTKNKHFLTPNIILQSIATLPSAERSTLEVVSTIFHVMANHPRSDQKSKLNLDVARSVVKSDAFINWCVKKLIV